MRHFWGDSGMCTWHPWGQSQKDGQFLPMCCAHLYQCGMSVCSAPNRLVSHLIVHENPHLPIMWPVLKLLSVVLFSWWHVCNVQCIVFFSNDQTRKSSVEEDTWRLWRICCTVYAKICATRSSYSWQWTRDPDTSGWIASSAVISQESHKCTVCKCIGYLWNGCTNTSVSIWGRDSSLLACFRFLHSVVIV